MPSDGTELSLAELEKEQMQKAADFNLDGAIDLMSKCGAHLSRCCHFFHEDCLNNYIVAENKQNAQTAYMKQMTGMEQNEIQCPLCKGISNTYQPLLPPTAE